MKRIIEWWRRDRLADGSIRLAVVPDAERRAEECGDGEWIYSVVADDLKTQLSLTVRVQPGWETYGKDLTLHTNFGGSTAEHLRTAGAFVCEKDFETSSLLASAFVREHVIGKLSDPHDQMWLGLEKQWRMFDRRAREAQELVDIVVDHITPKTPKEPTMPPISQFTFDPNNKESQVIWRGMDRGSCRRVRIVAAAIPNGNWPHARQFIVEVPSEPHSAMGSNWREAPPEVAAMVFANVLLAQALGVPSSMTDQ